MLHSGLSALCGTCKLECEVRRPNIGTELQARSRRTVQGGSALFVLGTVDCASGKVGILQKEKVRAILKNVEESTLLTGSQENSFVNLAAVDAYHEVGILESNDTQCNKHFAIEAISATGRKTDLLPKKVGEGRE